VRSRREAFFVPTKIIGLTISLATSKPVTQQPVGGKIVEEFCSKFSDFRHAYAEGGLSLAEFDSFGATSRTLRQFIAACHDLDGWVRDFMLPNPDVG
jgi:transaldolase